MNQNLIKSMALLTAGLGLFNCKPLHKKEARLPNILLIVSDDLGWKDLACYGNTINETQYSSLINQLRSTLIEDISSRGIILAPPSK